MGADHFVKSNEDRHTWFHWRGTTRLELATSGVTDAKTWRNHLKLLDGTERELRLFCINPQAHRNHEISGNAFTGKRYS